MTRACGADDIKNILHPALFRKLRFQMIDDTQHRNRRDWAGCKANNFPSQGSKGEFFS
jgi:hypothetical protein